MCAPIDASCSLAPGAFGPVTLERIRASVTGKDKSLPRTHAISLLVRSASENRHADLEGLLESPSEPARIRSIAAVALGQLGDAAAEEILKKNAGASDPLVFSTVMRVLGNIGSPSALPAILSASAHVSGYTLEHARFAAALISYRFDLDGIDLPLPAAGDYLEVPTRDARAIQINPAPPEEIEACQRALGPSPYGIDVALAPVYQVGMDNQPWLVLLNRKIVAAQDAAARLEARKALLGLIALKIGSTASYSPSFLIFSSPAQANTLSFQIRRTTGAPMFAGSAQITTGAITFSLRSLKRPGAYAVDVAGTITEGRLEITRALRSAVLNPKREPSRRVPSVSLS